MFKENYNSKTCEETIKKIAKVFYVLGITLMCLGALAFIILLSIDDDLLLVGVIVFVAALVVGLCSMVGAHFAWGFGDIVGNVKKIASASSENNSVDAIDTDELPEL